MSSNDKDKDTGSFTDEAAKAGSHAANAASTAAKTVASALSTGLDKAAKVCAPSEPANADAQTEEGKSLPSSGSDDKTVGQKVDEAKDQAKATAHDIRESAAAAAKEGAETLKQE